MYPLILPLGIINIILVLIQLFSGLKIIRISFRAHRNFGILLAVSALLHGAIAIFFT